MQTRLTLVAITALSGCDAGKQKEEAPAARDFGARVPIRGTHVQIAEYGVELDVPPEATQRTLRNRIEIETRTSCSVTLSRSDDNPNVPSFGTTVFGTVPVTCSVSRTCNDFCTTLKPIAGLREPYPQTPVTILTHAGGGFAGKDLGGVSIWADGTVIFRGPKCEHPPNPRAHVSADRAAELVLELEHQGVLAHEPQPSEPSCGIDVDGFYTWFTLRTAKQSMTVQRASDCPWLRAADAAIERTVGPNPCR